MRARGSAVGGPSRWLAGLALLLALAGAAGGQTRPETLNVYGAADLAFAFREIVPLFERATGVKVKLVLGSTGTLAKQIEHGAPADAFFAANMTFVEDLRSKGVVISETLALYAQGRIVLATSGKAGPKLDRLEELLRPDVRRVAIANPDHAPYGRAAQEAFQAVGLWERIRSKLVYGENIRHTLQFLETGAVEAAIVALSIANVPGVRYTMIDARLHAPLNQAAAVIKRSQRPELALAFLQFVNGPDGRPIMKRYGFLLSGEF